MAGFTLTGTSDLSGGLGQQTRFSDTRISVKYKRFALSRTRAVRQDILQKHRSADEGDTMSEVFHHN